MGPDSRKTNPDTDPLLESLPEQWKSMTITLPAGDDPLDNQDLQALATEWKVHILVVKPQVLTLSNTGVLTAQDQALLVEKIQEKIDENGWILTSWE